jgi:hypothetical protein
MTSELSQDELKAALAAADRGMRLPYVTLVVLGALGGTAIGIALKRIDWGDSTHVLIVCAVVFLYATTGALAGILQTRQNAANARMIRALELLDERLTPR